MEIVDVVIVTHRSAQVVGELLDSLPTALDGLEARVIVVDNASPDETVEVLQRRDDCVVIRAENLGYAAGINRGVKELKGSGPILVLNPDVRMARGSVKPLMDALALPGTGIAAPRVMSPDGSLAPSLRREPTLPRALGLSWTGRAVLSEYISDEEYYDQAQVVDWALGAALMVSRECHERVGGWDESFFLYSEETDFCLRAREVGLVTRYAPESRVCHIGGASGQSARIHTMQIVNRVRLYARRHSRPSGFMYLILSVASEVSWLARGHRQSSAAIGALMVPRRRPAELNCSRRFLPL